jgi:hypothetical protein
VTEASSAATEHFARRRIGSPKPGGSWALVFLGFGKGLRLWIIGIPLPIVLLLALFWR